MRYRSCRFFFFFPLFCAVTFCAVEAQTSLKYHEPPQAIIDLVDARLTPKVEVSPGNGPAMRWVLIEPISALPSIADLAQPELRLAGLRFNPKTNGPSRGRYITALSLQAFSDPAGRSINIGEQNREHFVPIENGSPRIRASHPDSKLLRTLCIAN
jgi:hypothetical protein